MTARTDIELTREQATAIDFRLDRQSRNYASIIGLLKPGSSINAPLGRQRGSLGLSSVGCFWLDADNKTHSLPRFTVDDIVSLEWQPSMCGNRPTGKVTFRINGKAPFVITENECKDTFDGWTVALSGWWVLLQVRNLDADSPLAPLSAVDKTGHGVLDTIAAADAGGEGEEQEHSQSGARPSSSSQSGRISFTDFAEQHMSAANLVTAAAPVSRSSSSTQDSQSTLRRTVTTKLVSTLSGLTKARYLRRHRTKTIPEATKLPSPLTSAAAAGEATQNV